MARLISIWWAVMAGGASALAEAGPDRMYQNEPIASINTIMPTTINGFPNHSHMREPS